MNCGHSFWTGSDCALRSEVSRIFRSAKAIVQRHLDFESNPEGFLNQWAPAAEEAPRAANCLRPQDISTYRSKRPDDLITATVPPDRDLELQGHRADITILKAARAHAALMEKSQIENGRYIAKRRPLATPSPHQILATRTAEIHSAKKSRTPWRKRGSRNPK